jgi:hypothetical protein
MEFIYIIVENGDAYPNAYKNYKSAVNAVKENFPLKKSKAPYYNTYGDGRFLENASQILADLKFPIYKIHFMY